MGFFSNFIAKPFEFIKSRRYKKSFQNIFNYQIKRDQYNYSTLQPDQTTITDLEEIVNYKIKDKEIFIEALTHRSCSQNYDEKKIKSNERLEFLGDSVLNLIVGEYLFNKYEEAEEGTLTKIRSRLVNRKALFEYAQNISLDKYILMNPSAIINFPKGVESILADAFESLIAAIYIDGGFTASQNFISRLILSDKKIMLKALTDENYKSALLEYSQANGFGSPRYELITEEGPNHDPTFTIEVFVGNDSYGKGTGKNKKEAEQEAAKNALIKLSLI